jgi:hypothetical protein
MREHEIPPSLPFKGCQMQPKEMWIFLGTTSADVVLRSECSLFPCTICKALFRISKGRCSIFCLCPLPLPPPPPCLSPPVSPQSHMVVLISYDNLDPGRSAWLPPKYTVKVWEVGWGWGSSGPDLLSLALWTYVHHSS